MSEQFHTRIVAHLINAVLLCKDIIAALLRIIDVICRVLRDSERNLPINKITAVDGEECVVMGNAPSLNAELEDSKEFLVGKKILCVNQFARSNYFEKIRPDYYLIIDPAYWEESASITVKEIVVDLGNIIKEKVVWPMKIVMPVRARRTNRIADIVLLNKYINICYFNGTPISSCFKPIEYFLYRTKLAMPQAQNVLVAGIFIAISIGYKNIYIFGADHSWHKSIYIDENNDLYCMEPHCYDDSDPTLIPFYKDSAEIDRFKLHELFAALSRKFEGYIKLDAYSKYVGCKIYNASTKSYIDAFERCTTKSNKKSN